MKPLLCLCAALALAIATRAAAPQPYTEAQLARETWIGGAQVLMLSLAPDGRHVAGIAHRGPARGAFLVDVDTLELSALVRPDADYRYWSGQVPVAVHWIADDLLVVDHNNLEAVSVDRRGKPVARLGERFIRRMAEKGALAEHVLVYRDLGDREIDLVNARTGERKPYRIELPGQPDQWVFDAAGVLRAVTMLEPAAAGRPARLAAWYRADEKAAWQRLEEWPLASNDRWYPLRVLDEPDSLAVLSRQGRDTYAVFRYDIATRRHVEMMAGHPRDDILRVAGLGAPSVQAVVTGGIRPQVTWFDARWASVQAGVDAALPGRTNLLSGDKNGRVLVWSFGDVDPGRWFLLDTKAGKLREITEALPGVKPERMRPMETLTYPARDGLVVPAYLTRPAAPGPVPLVVLIHGGPNVRDHWEWSEDVQLFARAGWAVFQPQFRGSSGFGRRFEEAGYRQWGRAMQDDISDGVRYLVERGIADPKRVCIVGASYGGYAALWGAIATPELYRCGVSFAGVSDLRAQVAGGMWDDSTPLSREVMRQRVGDPDADADALDAVSPLRHAARAGIPLLIAHGSEDLRVLPWQSREMVRALEAAGRPVEWLPLANEGHSLNLIAARLRYYTALMNFLDRHLGGAPEAPGPAGSGAAR